MSKTQSFAVELAIAIIALALVGIIIVTVRDNQLPNLTSFNQNTTAPAGFDYQYYGNGTAWGGGVVLVSNATTHGIIGTGNYTVTQRSSDGALILNRTLASVTEAGEATGSWIVTWSYKDLTNPRYAAAANGANATISFSSFFRIIGLIIAAAGVLYLIGALGSGGGLKFGGRSGGNY